MIFIWNSMSYHLILTKQNLTFVLGDMFVGDAPAFVYGTYLDTQSGIQLLFLYEINTSEKNYDLVYIIV